MPEVPAPITYRCDGCGRHFDGERDLSPARIGAALHNLCEACYHSALGPRAKDVPFVEARKMIR